MADKPRNVGRIEPTYIQRLDKAAALLSLRLNRRVTRLEVIRILIDAFLKEESHATK